MALFRCVADGCTVITARRRAPATCPDTNRCEFEECDEPAVPAARAPEAPAAPVLRVEIGGKTWPVADTAALGRNGDVDPESFREHLSVSRRHCQLSRAGNEWTLLVLSEASPTVLDGQTILAGSQVTLPGPTHELILGGSMSLRLVVVCSSLPFTGALDELLRGQAG